MLGRLLLPALIAATLTQLSSTAAPAAKPTKATGTSAVTTASGPAKTYSQWVQAGHAEMQKNKPTAAMASYTAAVKLNPNDPYARRCLAYSLVAAGYPGQGAQQMELVIGMAPAPTIEDLSYAGSAYARGGQYQKSIRFYQQASVADPNNPLVMVSLAEVQKLAGMLKEAKESATRALPLAVEPELKRRAMNVLSDAQQPKAPTTTQTTQSNSSEGKPNNEM